jgi:hypothetical protein
VSVCLSVRPCTARTKIPKASTVENQSDDTMHHLKALAKYYNKLALNFRILELLEWNISKKMSRFLNNFTQTILNLSSHAMHHFKGIL